MTDAIIGGAIAAAIGAVCYAGVGLWLEHRREKVQRLTIVDTLLAEIVENLTICQSPKIREMWWLAPFKIDAYRAYKGRLFFLPRAPLTKLIASVIILEGCNIMIQTRQSRESFVQPVDDKPEPIAEYLIKDLEFVKDELLKWKRKHTGFLSIFHR